MGGAAGRKRSPVSVLRGCRCSRVVGGSSSVCTATLPTAAVPDDRIRGQTDPECEVGGHGPEHRRRRGVRHEALFDRVEVKGLRRWPVVAGRLKLEAA
jgi:hypothetical protein